MVNNIQNSSSISPLVQPFNWVSVPLEEVINSGLRLEASVYATEAEKAKLKVLRSKNGFVSLAKMINTHHCPRFKRIFVKKSDFGIYQPSQIREIQPQPIAYISDKTNTDIDLLRVKKGQILMTCSGTIGKVTYVSDTLNNLIFSHDLLRINVKENEYAGYVYTYFLSPIGNSIIQSSNYGSVIKHIEPEHLMQLPIPNAPDVFKAEIHHLVVDSFALRDESNRLLQQAEQRLKTALKLPALEAFEQTDNQPYTFSINSQQLAGRFEANFHHPVVQKIEQHLKQHAQVVSTLADSELVSSIILPARFKRHYVSPEFGVPFLGGKEILELDPRGEKYLSLKQHSDLIRDQLTLQENMLLITCSGTIGKVVLVPSYWAGWTASQHLLRVNPKSSELAGYLYVWLNSPWALPLIQRHTYGSVIFEIDQHHLTNVSVPLVEKVIMQEINGLALRANQLRSQAFEKEQQALAKFESVLDA